MKSNLTIEIERKPDSVVVKSDEFEIFFVSQEFASMVNDFAIWAALPIAMRTGRNLFLKNPVSKMILKHI